MTYLQELIPTRRYSRVDYLNNLKALLPRGILWRIPLPDENDIAPAGIPTAEGFGVHNVRRTILPSGIIGAEGLGDLIVIIPFLSQCTFGVDLCPLQFDSEFLTNWYQTTESGQGIAQAPTDGWSRIYPPTGLLLTGDFTIEWGFWRSASEPGVNKSIHLDLINVTNSDSSFLSNSLRGINGGLDVMPAGPIEQRMKLVRVSGVIWCYRWTGSVWQREDDWVTPGSSTTDNGDVYIRVDGATAQNGISYIQITGTLT